MGLSFIIGRAGTGKSTLCLDQICARLVKDPAGDPLIFLVPEQATHQMEVELSRRLGGTMGAQVLSFRRLSWKILSQLGGAYKLRLGELGKTMLIRKILLERRSELRVFAHSTELPGLADLLAKTIDEMKMYCIKPEQLHAVSGIDSELTAKLADLYLIYSAFEESLGEDMIDPADDLGLLADKIPRSHDLAHTTLWVDGFKGFTPQELVVLSRLMVQVRQVMITLPLDPELVRRGERGERVFADTGDEVFTPAWETYITLYRLGMAAGVEIDLPLLLDTPRRFTTPALSYLEQAYFQYPAPLFVRAGESVFPAQDQCAGITLKVGAGRRAEVEGVACELIRLSREQGMRWKDMAILTRDLSLYYDVLEKVLTAYGIPHFMDYKEPLIHHPLIELILSALDLAAGHWDYEPLFRALKTDFFPFTRDQIDRLENYCLAHGLHGSAWLREEPWTFGSLSPAVREDINAVRDSLRSLLSPFTRPLSRPAKVRDITQHLFNLLSALQVPEQMEEWAVRAQGQGDLNLARLHRQIWQAAVDVMDELVGSLGQHEITVKDYTSILSSGLENLRLGLIPPGLDQVLVGGLDRSRSSEIKVLFLLGASDGILPFRPSTHGLLDPKEREELHQAGIELAPQGLRQLYDEHFYIYTALTRARETLYVSYPLADEEGKGIFPSPVISRLKTLFPTLRETPWADQWLDIVASPRPLLTYYAAKRTVQGLSPEEQLFWQAVERGLAGHPLSAPMIRLIQQGGGENQEKHLPSALAVRLYGRRLPASISRLEMFNRCPFAHYARYGLKLRERPVQTFARPDMGQFFHDALHDFARTLYERDLDWGQLSKGETWTMVEEIGNRIAPKLQSEILLSKARYRYLTYKLKKTLHHTVNVLGEHARRGVFRPIRLEMEFGPHTPMSGGDIELSGGHALVLQGRVDRIDRGEVDGKVYLRVIDYKSQETALSLDNIYYGLNLQLLTYLDIALSGAELLIPGQTALPAGFLYFPVVEPLLKETVPLGEEEIEARRLTAARVQGYLLADPAVLQAMDTQISTEGFSSLLNVRLKRDGSFSSHSKVLSPEQFDLLRRYLHRHLHDTGQKILAGDISIAPYHKGDKIGCTYCAYASVCHFDPGLAENPYRQLPELKGEQLWQQLAGPKEGDEA